MGQGFLTVSLQLHKWGRTRRRRRADRGAGRVWGGGVPSPSGKGAVPLPRNFFLILSQYGEFWCILGGIFLYTVSQKNPCDYVFDDNLNSKRPIVIIFGTVIT